MKKLVYLILLLLGAALVLAEAPQKFSYQAIVRDSQGDLVKNTTIDMQISIYYYTSHTTISNVYVETHSPVTNANGLVTIQIGGGTVKSGTFATIDWAAHQFYIKTEIDPGLGIRYSITSDTQLLSVPYALHASTASSLTNKSLSLNIYGAFLPDNKATFTHGFGINSSISFPDTQISTFSMNFTLPQDYVTGDPIKIRMLVSANSTGAVSLLPNSISVLRAGSSAIVGGNVTTGLSIGSVNILTANLLYEIMGGITTPVAGNPLRAGDVITFNYYRNNNDANTGVFRIHGIEIRY